MKILGINFGKKKEPEEPKRVILENPVRIVTLDKPEWTYEHAKALKNYMDSAVGKDMGKLMNYTEIHTNTWAVGSLSWGSDSREYRAGVAYGVALAFSKLRELARISEVDNSEKDELDAVEEIIKQRLNGHL